MASPRRIPLGSDTAAGGAEVVADDEDVHEDAPIQVLEDLLEAGWDRVADAVETSARHGCILACAASHHRNVHSLEASAVAAAGRFPDEDASIRMVAVENGCHWYIDEVAWRRRETCSSGQGIKAVQARGGVQGMRMVSC